MHDDVMEGPIQAPPPHQAGQGTMFPVETAFGPMALTLVISQHKVPRRRCTGCGSRRVCFFLGLSDIITSPPLCAKCAGIR